MSRLLSLSLALIVQATFAPFGVANDDDPEPPPRKMSLDRILKTYPRNKDAVEKLFLVTLGRKPTAEESVRLVAFLDRAGEASRRKNFEDMERALLNTKEYLDRKNAKKPARKDEDERRK